MRKPRAKHPGGRPRTLPLTKFGQALEAAARARGLTRADLAARAGLPPSSVARWMTSPTAPRLEIMHNLAKAAGADLDTLVKAALGR